MKKIISTIILSAVIIIPFLFTVQVLAQNTEYTVLAPLPGTTSCENGVGTNCKTTLEKYLPGMFNLLIGLSAAFAVLMIVLGGFQYMSTDALQKKQDGKQRIQNAIYGLFLVIGAWLILYTINPNLLTFNLNIDAVKIQPGTSPGTLSPANTGGVGSGSVVLAAKATCPNCTFTATSYNVSPENMAKFSCQTCSPLGSAVPTNGNTNTNVDASIKDGILALNTALNQQGIGWRLNEAFPPTVNHKASCSYNGTCIDAGLNSPTASNVKTFVETASSNGLRAQYEVQTAAEQTKLISDLRALGMTGDLTKTVIVVPTINNHHFSVYKQ